MKIFFLIHDDYAAGGLQRSTIAARDCLAEAGHEVTIYCIKTLKGGFAGSHPDVHALGRNRRWKPIFWAGFLQALRREIATGRPDLCIGMGLSTSILLVLATLGMRRPRLFGSERAYPPATPVPAHWRMLRRFAFRRLDKVICQTGQTADWFETAMGLNRRRLAIIPNVVDAPSSDPAAAPPELAPFSGQPLIACIGRLEPQKGFDMALPIFAGTAEQRPDARFLIVGEGPLEARLKTQASHLGLEDILLFLPRLPGLGGLWPRVSIFLLTSRFEGIPNVLAEAMAHGVASVAFDCPTGPSELIRDGENGFIVPLGDVDAAIRRCVELLEDAELRRRIGGQAEAVATRYSRAVICKLWNELVEAR